jgi:hypothetical protein
VTRRRGKGEAKRKEKRAENGEGNREIETNWVERETNETEKHKKKTGEYRLGN